MNITKEGEDFVKPRFVSSSDMIHALMQTGKFSLTDLINLTQLFPTDKPLPKDYAELLEETFKKQLKKEPFLI